MLRNSFLLGLICALFAPLGINAQETTVTLSGGSGATGDVIASSVTLDTTVVVQGWSLGICHPEADLTLLSANDGATTQTVNGGSTPDFNEVNLTAGGVTVGVVISFVGSSSLDAGTGYELLLLDYELIGTPDVAPIDATLEFCSTLGSPPVDNVVVSGGSSLVPVQNNAVIQIMPPPDFCLDLVCSGGVSDSLLTWTECTPFDYVLIHRDGVLIAMSDAGAQEYLDENLAPGSYVYSLIGVVFTDPDPEPTIVTNFCSTDIIPVTAQGISPVTGHYLGGETISVSGTGFLAAADTVVSINGIPLENQTVLDDNTVTGTLPASNAGVGAVDVEVVNSLGAATIDLGFTYGFIRGVVNGDVLLDIGDAMYIAMYLFSGGAEPACLEAAEANGDGVIDIADSIYVVAYLFRNGPFPAAPFPQAGLDDDPTGGFGCNP
jgi:hypothetical protein